MINDRGSIKWTSLMLPEHVEMLKQLWEEDKKQSKPLLDEHELESINETVKEALEYHKASCVTIFESSGNRQIQGYIIAIDGHNQSLKFQKLNSSNQIKLSLANIVNIEII